MRLSKLTPLIVCVMLCFPLRAQTSDNLANLPQRDGSHDFDFLIGDWTTHVRSLAEPLSKSRVWVEYNGRLNDRETPDGAGNVEDLEVASVDKRFNAKGKVLYRYNAASGLWSLQGVVKEGVLSLPFAVGSFSGTRGAFIGKDEYKGRPIELRYVWINISPKSARLERSYSPDAGKTWEINWICELSR